jgi:hypothetical protein
MGMSPDVYPRRCVTPGFLCGIDGSVHLVYK